MRRPVWTRVNQCLYPLPKDAIAKQINPKPRHKLKNLGSRGVERFFKKPQRKRLASEQNPIQMVYKPIIAVMIDATRFSLGVNGCPLARMKRIMVYSDPYIASKTCASDISYHTVASVESTLL